MAYKIVTTASGYEHAVQPVPPTEHTVRTVCNKSVKGVLGSVTSVEQIRCRPCKKAVYKGRPCQETKG